MKFYNPFKPHVVKDANGDYRIRAWYGCWMYLVDENEREYWVGKSYRDCASLRSYTEAKNVLMSYLCRKHNEALKHENSKIEKVVHD